MSSMRTRPRCARSRGAGGHRRVEVEHQGAVAERTERRPPALAAGVRAKSTTSRRSATPAAQGLDRAVGQHAAVPITITRWAQRLDVVEVVGGQEDGRAALAVGALDEVAHGQLGGGVEADGRLVEEEEARRVQQRRHQLAAHALAEPELPHRRVEHGARSSSAMSSSRVRR